MVDRVVTASELARNTSEVLDEVHQGSSVLIERHGRAVARLVPMATPGSALLARLAGRGRQVVTDEELVAGLPDWEAM